METLSIDFRRSYPVFPLPGTVLFPNTLLPLHIFEPRYRRMVSDALDSFGHLAIALFKEPPSARAYLDDSPALRPTVGLGTIAHYEQLTDDRYLVLLQGVCRARIVDEVPHHPYRLVHLMPLDIEETDEVDLADIREQLHYMLETHVMHNSSDASRLRLFFEHHLPTKLLIDQFSSVLCPTPEQRYALLAEADPATRGRRLMQIIDALPPPGNP